MKKRFTLHSILIVLALAHTSQLQTQDQYDQAKKFIQEKVRDSQRDYPVEYQAAKEGLLYGTAAGALKSFIPLIPKRGKGPISCALIGGVAGTFGMVALQSNASYLLGASKKLEYSFFLEGDKDLKLKYAENALKAFKKSLEAVPGSESKTEEAVPGSESTTENVKNKENHLLDMLLKKFDMQIKQEDTTVELTEAERNKAVVAKYDPYIKTFIISLGLLLA